MSRDVLTVQAATEADARDIARRQWDRDGLTVVVFLNVTPIRPGWWRVPAHVALRARVRL